MNKFGLVVIAVAMLMPFGSALASQAPMVDEQGKITMIDTQPPAPRPLTAEETMAWQNPGTKVPVNPISIFEKVDFWHIAKIQKYPASVIYEDGAMRSAEGGKTVGEPILAWYKIAIMAAIAMMIVSNVAMRRKQLNAAAAAAVISFIAVLVSVTAVAAAPTAVFTFATIAGATIIAAGAIIATSNDFCVSKKSYWMLYFIFYVLTIVAIVL